MEKDLCIFVCTHGRFGEELIKSAEMIAGKSENVYSFSLLPGMPPEEYKEMMEAALQKEAGKKSFVFGRFIWRNPLYNMCYLISTL